VDDRQVVKEKLEKVDLASLYLTDLENKYSIYPLCSFVFLSLARWDRT
jgi:hypothetical protein